MEDEIDHVMQDTEHFQEFSDHKTTESVHE